MLWNDAYMDPLGFLPKNEQEKQDKGDDQFIKAARESYEHCIKIASLFKSPKGQQVLKQWRKATIECSAWSPALAQQATLEAANAHAYAREGQNAFVRNIEDCIKLAHSCKTLDDYFSYLTQNSTGTDT